MSASNGPHLASSLEGELNKGMLVAKYSIINAHVSMHTSKIDSSQLIQFIQLC